MAVTRRRRSARPARMPRRKRIWARQSDTIDLAATGTPVSVDLCDEFCAEYGVNSLPPGATVSGIRADYSVTWPAHDFATGYLVFGIRVAGESDLTQMDGPVQGKHLDWMAFQTHWTPGPSADVVTGHFEARDRALWVRSSRKVEELQQRLVLTASSAARRR